MEVRRQDQVADPEDQDNDKNDDKKKFLIFLISFPTLIFSQSVSDIVDFSIDNPLGTARFESMGGAFGALGGDYLQ